MDKNQYIGITEVGDPSFRLDIFDKLYDGNIIITKRLTNKLIEKLVENKEKCILHFTVNGMGGSKIEPLVPTVETSFSKCVELVNKGFPINQIVLRIDPIVPSDKGIKTAINVLETFKEIGIKRVRISFLDMYNHVKERFAKENVKIPYENFHASNNDRCKGFLEIKENAINMGYESVEICGEPDFGIDLGDSASSCISQKDIDILGLTEKINLINEKGQRKTCHCPSNKKELITGEKPHRCKNSCLYCFWKDND